MTPERWQEVVRLYAELCDKAEDQRAGHLARVCADAEIRAEVTRLLDVDASSFLEPPDAGSLTPHVAEDLAGKRLGDFEIEEEIGRGGMGVVYRAHQTGLGRKVAVKILGARVREDPMAVERFKREALAASRLVHAHIVPILAFGQDHGLLYYAMHYVDGWSMRLLMDQPSVGDGPDLSDPRRCAKVMRDVAGALAYSHEQGVLHRDIKPHNILIDRRQHTPSVIDFGLAKVLDLEAISKTGQSPGTPLYMSPEQVRATTQPIDRRTDVYSAGAVLYELLTGRPPFCGETIEEILFRITHDRPVAPRQLRPELPKDLETITLKALQRERVDRYECADDLCDDLDRFLQGSAIVARPPGIWRRMRGAARRHRLAVATTVGVGIGFGVWSVFASPARAASIDKVTRFEVTTAEDVHSVQTSWRLADRPEWTESAANEDGASTAKRLSEGQLDLQWPHAVGARVADIWIVMANEDGQFAELQRRVRPGETVRASAVLRHPIDVRDGMVEVPGGKVEVSYVEPLEAGARPRKILLHCEAFLIDRAPVTIGDYLQYLGATDSLRPPGWTDDHVRAWVARRQGDWHDLPMTGLTWSDAQAYAESRGKRLPTLVEWELAMGKNEGWLDPELTDAATTPFNLADGPRNSATLSEFVHWAKTVQPDEYGPHDIQDPFGNVKEWLADPPFLVADSQWDWRHIHGGDWHTQPRALFRTGFPVAGLNPMKSPDIGFRCAKSLRPTAKPFVNPDPE